MPNPPTSKSFNETQRPATETETMMSVVAPAVGWLVPGAGHLIQKRWIRGVLLLASIFSMFLLGLAMQGRVYKPNGGDILDILGFIGAMGAGGLYRVARIAAWGVGGIAHAAAGGGGKFIIVDVLQHVLPGRDAL